jgi:hypothetical protein
VRPVRRGARSVDAGHVTPAFVACVGLTVLLLAMATNLYAVHYARGVLQGAVEEGARQGVADADAARCAERVDAAVRGGLGSLARQVEPSTCTVTGAGAVATVQARFTPWVPGVPVTTARAEAVVHGLTTP